MPSHGDLGSQGPPPDSKIIYHDLPKVPSFAKAHGVLMGLTFVVILPLGALLIRSFRLKNIAWKIHAACQLTGLVTMIAGMAVGIRLGKILDRLHNNTHTILGTIVVAAMLLQPFIGYLHHRQYVAKQKATAWTHLHVWYGRILILLGITNGGLGLKLASDTPAHSLAGVIVYSILAGVVGLMLLDLIFVVVTGRRQTLPVAGFSVQGEGS